MTGKGFKVACALLIIVTTGLMAREPYRKVGNEDLRFIVDWVKTEKAKELASRLKLDTEQIASLRTIRAEVDRLKEEFKTEMDAYKAEAAIAFAEIRTRLTETETLAEADRDTLRAFRIGRRDLKRAFKQKKHEVVWGIASILSDQQKAIIREMASAHRRELGFNDQENSNAEFHGQMGHRRSDGDPKGDRPFQGTHPGQDRDGRHKRYHPAKFLLSDAFLNQF